jgi:hypothetical protein
MKKLKYIYILLMMVMVSSCGEDFVTIPVQDRPTIANYYKSAVDVRAATASLYGVPWFEFNDKFFWTAGEELSGNLYHTWDQEGRFFFTIVITQVMRILILGGDLCTE